MCIHGFMDSWRTWQLVLPRLERDHDVLAPTLPGHAGGPPLGAPVTLDLMPDAVEAAMDAAGFETAHLAGNSLGGFVALQLAARGRALSVVALAPAGGWDDGGAAARELLTYQRTLQQYTSQSAAFADAIVATPEGRRRATQLVVENYEHIPADLIAHQLLAIARCTGAQALIDYAQSSAWTLDAATVTCPVRIVWGTADRLLPWPAAAARFLRDFPVADWVVLDGVGHAPQLDVPLECAELIAGFSSS